MRSVQEEIEASSVKGASREGEDDLKLLGLAMYLGEELSVVNQVHH